MGHEGNNQSAGTGAPSKSVAACVSKASAPTSSKRRSSCMEEPHEDIGPHQGQPRLALQHPIDPRANRLRIRTTRNRYTGRAVRRWGSTSYLLLRFPSTFEGARA